MKYDIVIVGAGISGAVLAERFASVFDKKVLVIEKREHIGGNCYDFLNADGIFVSKYGAHLFHTNYDDVWEYVNRFSEWYQYEHRVLSFVDGKLVPVPINIDTINALFDLNLNASNVESWLKTQQIPIEHPQNSEEAGLARFGKILYEKMFKNYTQKQWDIWPKDLDPSVIHRIPIRLNHDDRYFQDKYQALPQHGYARIFENMLNHPNITVKIHTDFFEIRNSIKNYEKLFYTGPIDQFFNYKFRASQPLQYRSLRFGYETYDKEFFQCNSVINYPNDFDFTRIIEFKHMTRQKHPHTTICKEYGTWDGEPYYPVPSEKNKKIYALYQQESLQFSNIHFVGRLANYKYFNMDQAFKNALDLFHNITS